MKAIFLSIMGLLITNFAVVVNAKTKKSEVKKKQDSQYVLILKKATKKFVPINIKYRNEWNKLFYDGEIPDKNSKLAKFVDVIGKSKSLKIISDNYLKIKNHKGKLARNNPYNYHKSMKLELGVMTFVYFYKIKMAQYAINNEWDKFLDTFDRYIYFNSVASRSSSILPFHFPELYYLLQKNQVPDYVYDRMNDKINGLIKCYIDLYLDKGNFIKTFCFYREMQILNLSLKYKNNHGKWPTAFDTNEIGALFKTFSSSSIRYEVAMNNLDEFKNQFEFGFMLKVSKKGLINEYQKHNSVYFGICLNPTKMVDKESVKRCFYKDAWLRNMHAYEGMFTDEDYKNNYSFIKKLKFEKINNF